MKSSEAEEAGREADERLAALLEELLERARGGEALDVERLVREHPAQAGALREVLPGLLALEEAASSAGGEPAAATGLPERLGPYRILRVLGRGGMGIVYLAADDELHRRVALKLLPPQLGADPEFLARFRRESLVAARLEHPGIVRVYGVGTDHGHSYYAMQYVDGCSLDRLIARAAGGGAAHSGSGRVRDLVAAELDGGDARAAVAPELTGPWTPVEAARLAREVASALAFAHAQGVVHRDVKPGNVLVDREGRALVADFGLCRLDEGSAASGSSGVVGTLRYMAPEQLEGAATPRSDVYGVGLLLYELLALRPAFPETSRAVLAQRVQAGRVLRVRRVAPEVARDLETIVLKATARLPEERYASAAELAADLGAYLEMRPIRARPPSTRYLLRLAVRRNPLAAGLLAAAALAIGLGFWRYVADIAEERLLRRRSAYVAEVSAASAALRIGAVTEARRRLDAAPFEEREWEWRHLDASAEQSLVTCRPTGAPIWDLALSPDGRRIAAASRNEVVLLDVEDGRVLARAAVENAERLAFHATEPALVVLARNAVVELDPDTLELRSTSPAPWWGEFAIVGERLWIVGALSSGTISLDPATGTYEPVEPHLPIMRSIGSLADGTGWMVGVGGELCLGEGESSTSISLPVGRTRVVRAELDPEGRRAAVALESGAVLVYDIHQRRVIHTLRGHEGPASDVGFVGRDTLVSSGTDNLLRVWDLERGFEVARLSGHSRNPWRLVCDPDRGRVVSTDASGAVHVWLPRVGGGGGLLGSHDWDTSDAAFSPDGRLAATCGRDGTVRVWDLARMEPVRVWMASARPVRSVSFGPAPGELTAVDDAGELWRWDLFAGRELVHADLTERAAYDSATSAGGSRLVVATDDGLLVLDARSLVLEATIDCGGRRPVRLVADDRERMFVGFADGSTALVDLADGGLAWSVPSEDGGTFAMALDSSKERLAVVRGGTTATVFEAATGRVLGEYGTTLDGPGGSLYAVAFGDGDRLFAATSNGTLLVWDLAGDECLAHLSSRRWDIYVLVSDGERLLTAGSGARAEVQLWDTVDARARWTATRVAAPYGSDAARAEHTPLASLSGRMAWCVEQLSRPGGSRGAAARLGISIYINVGLTGESAVVGGLACRERGEQERARGVLERAAVLLPVEHPWQAVVAEALEGL